MHRNLRFLFKLSLFQLHSCCFLSILRQGIWHPSASRGHCPLIVYSKKRDNLWTTQAKVHRFLFKRVNMIRLGIRSIPCLEIPPGYEAHLSCEYHFHLVLYCSTLYQSSATEAEISKANAQRLDLKAFTI
jgi:hypothetical protein